MRPKKIELDPRRWEWNTETGPAGFWIKQRGPFVWWGKGLNYRVVLDQGFAKVGGM